VVNPFSDVSFACTLRSDVITFSPIFPSFFMDVMATFMTHFSQLVLISKGPIHLFLGLVDRLFFVHFYSRLAL
jgi:hypothetical protein